MADKTVSWKCPACTGPLHYDEGIGKLKCDYCESEYQINEIEDLYKEKEEKAAKAFEEKESNWDIESAGNDWGDELEKMRAYSCSSCGAELICDDTTAATSCPYCGNPTIVPGQFSGNLKPDLIIPFKLDKKTAKEALKKHYRGKTLLPKVFKAENHIEELKGIYVPFWLFDADAHVDMEFDGRRSTSYRSGDYIVTETMHYEALRIGDLSYEMVPVDGSKKMPDDYMDSIEPFDYKEIKPFSTAYLPGFLADKYDVSAKEASERAEKRCINTAISSAKNTVKGYESVSTVASRVNIKKGEVKYALLPVWLLSTKWRDKNYLFAMNGQSGKLVGDLPCDKRKARIIFFLVLMILTVLISVIAGDTLGRMILRIMN